MLMMCRHILNMNGIFDQVLVPLQHPDLIEKRRKAFADVIKQHLKNNSSPITDGIHEDGGE